MFQQQFDPYALDQMGMGYGMFGAPKKKKKNGVGFNPLMMMSPLAGLMMESPKHALPFISPAFGLANLFGAFK
jgi:hypothetical protein